MSLHLKGKDEVSVHMWGNVIELNLWSKAHHI
jgi:hypothetical protein